MKNLVSNVIAGDQTTVCGQEATARDASHLVQHLDAAYNLARWLMGNETDAEDMVQEAYLRAVRSLRSLRGWESRPWLLAIVRNVCYDSLRRSSKMPRQEMSPEKMEGIRCGGPSPEMILLEEGDGRRIREALDALPAHLREIIILRELEQLTYKEIAAISGISHGTVMSRLSRARRLLERSQASRRCRVISRGLEICR